MKVEEMRTAIEAVYPGPKWRLKVQCMDDRQVIAIYRHMLDDNIFEKRKKAEKRKEKMKEQGVQMTIWDFMMQDDENGGKNV